MKDNMSNRTDRTSNTSLMETQPENITDSWKKQIFDQNICKNGDIFFLKNRNNIKVITTHLQQRDVGNKT